MNTQEQKHLDRLKQKHLDHLKQKLARTLFSIERTSQHSSYQVGQASPPIYKELAHHIVNDEDNLLELVSQLNAIGEYLNKPRTYEAANAKLYVDDESIPEPPFSKLLESLAKGLDAETEAKLKEQEEFYKTSPIVDFFTIEGVHIGYSLSEDKLYAEVARQLNDSIKKFKFAPMGNLKQMTAGPSMKGKGLTLDIVNAMIDEVLEENRVPVVLGPQLHFKHINSKGWIHKNLLTVH